MDSSREGGPGRGQSSASRQGDESGRSQGAGATSSGKRNRESEAESRGMSAATPSSRLVSPKARNLAELPRSDLQPSARKSLGTDSGNVNSPQTPRQSSSTFRKGAAANGYGPSGTPSTPSSSNQNNSNRTPSTVASGRGSDGAPKDAGQALSTPTSSVLPAKPALDVNGSIWGTNINNEEVSSVIRTFLTDFKLVDLEIAVFQDRRVLFQEENPEEFLGETVDRPDGWNYPADLSASAMQPLLDQQALEMPYYMELLQSLIDVSDVDENEQGNTVLNVGIDAQHIQAFHASLGEGQRLYRQLILYPKEIIPLFDIQLNAQFSEMYMLALQPADDTVAAPRVRARVFNLEQVTRMRALDPTDIDTLVAIKGMVIRTNAITPDMKIGHFKCTACDYGVDVRLSGGRLEDPASCEHCGARKTMELVHNRCLFLDKQAIKIQETPESIPEGETPLTLQVFAYEDMVDTVLPGDRVTITGVFRAQGQKVVARARRLRSVFSTYIDAIHMAKNDKDRMTAEDPSKDAVAGAQGAKSVIKEYTADFKYSADVQKSADAALVERVRAMNQDENLYSRLAHSLAPSVWELDDVKKGILLQLFGGCNKNLGSLGKIRGEINVLLCGDPGTAKSQLLSYVHRIAPRGMYTSGTGSSAVGLTAYITKDPESKEPVLESGALVLSDRGVCCIDEFDKMSDSTRSILHEVMEQQTVSIAKAGIIATLNARTSILASANPKESRYNPAESVVENLQLPPTLLSRFDLLYLILDKVDPTSDARLAHHLVTLHWPEEERLRDEAAQGAPRHFTRQQVMEYISYVKKHFDPQISAAAQEELVKGYAEMRRSGTAGGRRTISATTRQLESLIRLGEAHARMRMSQVVQKADIVEAIRLMRTATQQAAMDPRTGTIDMNLIATGHAASEASTITAIADCLREFLPTRASSSRKFSDLATIRKEAAVVLEQLVGTIPNDSDLRTALRMLAQEDEPVLSYSRTGGQDVVKLLSTRGNERSAYNL